MLRTARNHRRSCRTARSRSHRGRDRPGLVYLNNRYHDPTLGAFISVDPLVVDTGEPYVYGSATPVVGKDASGLCTTFQQDSESGDWICSFYSADGGSVHVGNKSHTGSGDCGQHGCDFGGEIRYEHGPYEDGYGEDSDEFWLASEINEHLTLGYTGCLLVCLGATYQDGHLMPTVGGMGLSFPGPSLGWATQAPENRPPAAWEVSLTILVGTGGKIGMDFTDEHEGTDYEQWVDIGLGFSFGPSWTWDIELW